MARIGMDVDVVTQHGSALKSIGDHDIPSLLGRVDSLVQELQGSWWGPDAQQFHANWTGHDRPALHNIAHEISTYGQQAVLNAQQQAQTSAASGGN
jgi:uncharacterized protein YukE